MNSSQVTRHSSLRLLSVIIPARDEEGCIASTVEHLHLELDLRGVPHEIIVVDDGSKDRTWPILQEEARRLNSADSSPVSGLRSPNSNPPDTRHTSPVTRHRILHCVQNPGPHGFGRAITLFLLVLLGMFIVGKFPTYYGWMLTFPLAAILAAMFDRLPAGQRVLRAGAVAIAVLACLVGFPVQAAVALNDWPYRTPARVDAWLQTQIRPDDTVFCDYPFYYLAKEKAHKVFVGRYSRVMTPQELDSLDLVLLSKTFCDWSHPETLRARATGRADWGPSRAGLLGNDWRYGILSAPNYSCAALRLAPVSGPLVTP